MYAVRIRWVLLVVSAYGVLVVKKRKLGLTRRMEMDELGRKFIEFMGL